MSKETETTIRADGLRYQSKKTGSPFSGTGSTRSCFKCGRHRTADQLQTKKVLGRTEMICKPSCETAGKTNS
ncbi:MAG: hypothetical protein HZB72_15400 [Burkholderiales bacterium]|nr:hypothetical protein [Burkholderiales bacterium]